jgi:hypothetical protein
VNILAVASLVGALSLGFAGGHYVATNSAEAKHAKVVVKLNEDFQGERDSWSLERDDLHDERMAITRKAAEDLQKQRAEAEIREAALRKAVKDAEKKYKARIKELEDARTNLDNLIDDGSPDGGLWINIAAQSCAAGTSGDQHRADVPKAAYGSNRSAGTIRCRIADQDAKALVQISDTSDQRTELLNKCIGVLNPVTDELALPSSEAQPAGDPAPIKEK